MTQEDIARNVKWRLKAQQASVPMIIALRVLGVLITTAGAAVALWGEPRRDNRLTPQGKFAVAFIALGLAVSIALEVLQLRSDKAEAKTRDIERLVERKWEAAEDQPLTSISLQFFQRHEMPVAEFLRYVGGITIELSAVSDPGVEVPSKCVVLVRRRAKAPDFENAFALAAQKESGEVLAQGDSIRLAERTQRDSFPTMPSTSMPRLKHKRRPPNEASERLIGFRGVVAGPPILVTRGWLYSLSGSSHWIRPQLKACGFSAELGWKNLSLASEIHRLHDLRRVQLEVKLPYGHDLRVVDYFELAFGTASDGPVALDLRNVSYAEDEQHWVYSLSGPDLYTKLSERYRLDETFTQTLWKEDI